VTRIDALGRAFDPRMHEAVGLSDEGAAGRVLAEVRPGYLIGSDVLRPAAVLVGREPGP
jgi:molecular chaperone GrpE (heat shock protein)